MKTLIRSAVVALTLALATSPGFSQPTTPPAKPKPFGGKVKSVADGTIVVANPRLGEQTFKTDAATIFAKSDGTTATAADIKVGERVQIVPGAAEGQVKKVSIFVPKAKPEGSAAKPNAKAPAPAAGAPAGKPTGAASPAPSVAAQ